MSIEEVNKSYVAVCDNCGLRLPNQESFQEAVQSARQRKWHTVKNESCITDYCTYCWKELKEDQT